MEPVCLLLTGVCTLGDASCFCFRSSPRANITLSGKKRRKLLKQLQHMQQEKASMEGKAMPKCPPLWENCGEIMFV